MFSFDLLRLLHHYPADVKPNLPLHPRKPGNPALSLQSKGCSEDRRCWGRSKCLDWNRRFLCTDMLGLPDPKGCWSRLPFHSLPLEFSLGTTKRNWYFDCIPSLWFTFWYWNTNHVAGEVALLEFLSILVLSVQSFFPLLQFQQLVPSLKLSFVSDLPHCLKQGKPRHCEMSYSVFTWIPYSFTAVLLHRSLLLPRFAWREADRSHSWIVKCRLLRRQVPVCDVQPPKVLDCRHRPEHR